MWQLAWPSSSVRRYGQAVATLRKVSELAPDDWLSRMNLSLGLIWSDKLADARAEIEQWPDNKLPTFAISEKYKLLREIETLSRNYDAALALASKIPDIPNRLPTVIIAVGNIKKNTDIGFIYLYKGDSARATQAFTAGRQELEGLRASNIDNADFYRDESLIAAGLDQHTEAVEAA